jgi:hypothetical protein
MPAASAVAQPLASPTGGWPTGMPEELKPLFPGHPEFDAAPWSTDARCADKGGDFGSYLVQFMRQDQRALYWALPVTQRVAQYAEMTGASEEEATQAVKDGKEPTDWPNTYPGGDENMSPPTGTCAADLAKWSEPNGNHWGFTWSAKPDAQSIALMKKQQYVDNLPDDIFEKPCSDHPMLCNRAYFVDCDKASTPGEVSKCQAWNVRVGKMFGGIWDWKEKHKDVFDRLAQVAKVGGIALVATNPLGLQLGLVAATAGIGMELGERIANSSFVKFVSEPGSIIDDWANSFKDSAVSLSTSVLDGLASISEFNPADPNFLRWYAISCGAGIFVMVITTLFTIYRTSAEKSTREEMVRNVMGYAPLGLVCMMFAPAAAQLLVELSHAVTAALASVTKQDTEQAVLSVSSMLGNMTQDTVVGGAIAGIVFFGLLFLGAMSLFFGMLMHAAALPILAGLTGVAFGLWAHPTLRKKAMRPIFVFVAIIFSKPVIFLGLGFLTTVIVQGSSGAYVNGDLQSLGALALTAVCFVLIGLAPWSLLKYAPFLPSSEDSEGFGSNGSAAGESVGNTLQSAQMAMSGSRGGGAGGAAADRVHMSSQGSTGGVGGGVGGGTHTGSGSAHGHSSTSHLPSSPGHSGKGGGSHTNKLMSAAGTGLKRTAGVAATGGVGSLLVGASIGGAAMNKAAQGAQNAPEQADMGDQ